MATEGAVVLDGEVGFVDSFAAVSGCASFFMVSVTFVARGRDAFLSHDVEMDAEFF